MKTTTTARLEYGDTRLKKARVKRKYGRCQILPSQFSKTKEPIPLSYMEIKEVGRSKKQ